jgi:hypothetical protein
MQVGVLYPTSATTHVLLSPLLLRWVVAGTARSTGTPALTLWYVTTLLSQKTPAIAVFQLFVLFLRLYL